MRLTLRARLVAAMVGVAIVVLGASYLATYALTRRALQDNALDNLRERSSELVAIAEDPTTAARPRERLRLALRLTSIDALVVSAGGTVSALPADGGGLPAPLEPDDLDVARLFAGEQVTGRRGDTVFLAIPTGRGVPQGRVVIVATDAVDFSVLRNLFPLLLLAGALVLVLASGAAAWIVRRLTRPIRAVERAAARIATGDLGARAGIPPGTDEELATLAATLNAMAAQLEQARGGERAFLLSVSHDLRTPLTSIRGYAEALADGTLDGADPEARGRAAAVIAAEARRLERLVRDLLDLSRLDSRQFSLHPRPCDAAEIVRDAAAAFAPKAEELGLRLDVDAPGPIPGDLDGERLAQIVANLVENALKYAATRVHVAAHASSPGEVAIVVDDDGPGIPPADRDAVFDRLYTVRETPGRTVGTGLGLAIVRELAGAMGGHALVAADSRFVVALPTNVTPAVH
jgi:two-component system sensor histidine kinase BaeS